MRFGSQHRLIDFALSNLVNAGFRRIVVLSRDPTDPVHDYLAGCWREPQPGERRDAVPALQIRARPGPYLGSAAALRDNSDLIRNKGFRHVVVLAADHVCRIDPSAMLARHLEANGDVTVAAAPVPIAEAPRFGVIGSDSAGRICDFAEKPAEPSPMAGDDTRALASMGTYVFDAAALDRVLGGTAAAVDLDIGRDLIPRFVEAGDAVVYDYSRDPAAGSDGYWRDVGTIDAYFRASMDLLPESGGFDLASDSWPIRTDRPAMSPARISGSGGEPAVVSDVLLPNGATVIGATVSRSVLAPGVRIGPGAWVEDAVLLDGVSIGSGAVVRRAIVGEHTAVPQGAIVDQAARGGRRWTTSESGVVVVIRTNRLRARHRSPPSPSGAPVPLQLVANLDV